jgi:hypothetical protein
MMKMKKKGYVFSLLVFLVFIAVFILVITINKSLSVVQDSNYEQITMMKISRLGKNIDYVLDNGVDCFQLNVDINSAALPFDAVLLCSPTEVLQITSKNGDYEYSITI